MQKTIFEPERRRGGNGRWVILPFALFTTFVSNASADNPVPLPLHLNAGGSGYVDASGTTWSGDGFYSGGATSSVSSAIFNAGSNQNVYKSERVGNFSYIFGGIANGSYTVNLKFAELTWWAVGQRVFNVVINGSPVLSNYDILKDLGGPYSVTAHDRSFNVTVANNTIEIDFVSVVDQAQVNGIEITPAAGGSSPPPTLPTISSFAASPASILQGQSTTLSWTTSGATSLSISGIGTVTGLTSKPVTPTTTTTYVLTATNSAGSKTANFTVMVSAVDSQAPTAPVLTSASASGPTQVKLAWAASSDNVAVTGYRINRNGVLLTTVSASTLSYQDSTVSASTTYSYSVQSYDAAGNYSLTSNTLQVTTPAPPTKPTISSFTAAPTTISSGQSSTLSWGVTNATSVSISGIGTVAASATALVSPTTTTSYVLTATNSAGTVTASATVTVNTADTQAPTTPVLTSASASGPTVVNLVWTVASDNVAVTGYQINRNGSMLSSVGPSTLSYQDSSASASTTYSYTVQAFDAAHNYSGLSNAIQVTTPAPQGTGSITFVSPLNNGSMFGTYPVSVKIVSFTPTAVTLAVDNGSTTALTLDSSGNYSTSLNTGPINNGPHTLTATAKNASGSSITNQITVTESDPAIVITSPTNNQTISGLTAISALIKGGAPVPNSSFPTGVNFRVVVQGTTYQVPMSKDSSGAYSAQFDTSGMPTGMYTFYVIENLASGSVSGTVSVSVSNPVYFIAPLSGATLTGMYNVTVGVNVANPTAVTLTVDNGSAIPLAASGAGKYTTVLSTALFDNGQHTLTAKVTDSAGTLRSASVGVSLNNPPLSVVAPQNNQTVSGSVKVTAMLKGLTVAPSNPWYPTGVTLFVDGGVQISPLPMSQDSPVSYSVMFDTTCATNETHYLNVYVNTASSLVSGSVVVSVNNPLHFVAPSCGSFISAPIPVTAQTNGFTPSLPGGVTLAIDGKGAVPMASDPQNFNGYTVVLDPRTVKNGQHVLTASATGTDGKTYGVSTIVTLGSPLAFSNPLNGQTVSRTLVASIAAQNFYSPVASATYPSGVGLVVDWGLPIAMNPDSSGNYLASVDTTLLANGQHRLIAHINDKNNPNIVVSTLFVVNNSSSGATDQQAPAAPTLISASAASAYEVDLGWSASTDNTSIAGYLITRNGVVVATLPASALAYQDKAANPMTGYTYLVQAYDAAGNYSNPSPVQVITPSY